MTYRRCGRSGLLLPALSLGLWQNFGDDRSLDAQRAMRAYAQRAGACLMLSTMLHSIATGNLLPAAVHTVCVDINPAVVTKLADRGSYQTIGVVTDVGLFVEQLADELERGS